MILPSVLLQPRGIISPSRFQEAGTSLVFGARPWALVSGSVVTFVHPHTSQRHGRGHPPPFRPSRPLFVYCYSSLRERAKRQTAGTRHVLMAGGLSVEAVCCMCPVRDDGNNG